MNPRRTSWSGTTHRSCRLVSISYNHIQLSRSSVSGNMTTDSGIFRGWSRRDELKYSEFYFRSLTLCSRGLKIFCLSDSGYCRNKPPRKTPAIAVQDLHRIIIPFPLYGDAVFRTFETVLQL